MKLAIFLQALFLGSALASLPLGTVHSSSPAHALDKPSSNLKARGLGPNDLQTNTAWSGFLLHEDGVAYQSISAEMVIPNVTFQYGFNKTSNYQASVSVGISGYLYGTTSFNYNSTGQGVLHSGFYYSYNSAGDNGVYPFWEWYDGPVHYWNSPLEVGDRVRFSVTATSNSSGSAIFESLTRGTVDTKHISAPAGQYLDLTEVEWIVESFKSDDPTLEMPDFGTMVWENMIATQVDGTVATLGGENTWLLSADPEWKITYPDVPVYYVESELSGSGMISTWKGLV